MSVGAHHEVKAMSLVWAQGLVAQNRVTLLGFLTVQQSYSLKGTFLSRIKMEFNEV